MKGFGEAETKLLIDEAVKAGETGESLSRVFERLAAKTKMAKGSVRNYYYAIVKSSKDDDGIKEKYGNITKLKISKPIAFTKDDETKLVKAIEDGKKVGKSTRKIIYELADGDDKLALRYQNKYRNLIKSGKVCKLDCIPVRPEDFKYFNKLSVEIDGLISRIKDKYALECLKLKSENDKLNREVKELKKQLSLSNVADYFLNDKKADN